MNSVGSIPELKGKGLFVFSDPGGAKPLLAYIKLNSNLKEYIVVSDRIYDFYADFNIEVSQYHENYVEDYLISFKPDFIFTGTSYTSKIELKFIKFGVENGFTCYSFIDHYTNFIERFNFNGTYHFPNFICVKDEKALALAESAKLPRPIIISGNYYHEYLKNWKPKISREDFMASINIPLTSKLIVYAPDPISNVGGSAKWGLDEITVWKSLENVLKDYSHSNYLVIFKLHPNQNKSKIIPIVRLSAINVIFDDFLHTNTLLYNSNCVVGIFSNILAEANLFKVPVIRCLENLKLQDPLEDMKIGSVAKSDYQLLNLIKDIFKYE